MRTLVHFGMPKTGTTTLQRTFALNADVLRASGVYYPKGLRYSSANHRIAAFCVMDPSSYPRHMREFQSQEVSESLFRELTDTINAELARQRPALLLLSSETLFAKIKQYKSQKYFSWLHGFGGTVDFVAYLRSPVSAYLAACQQKLRASCRIKLLKPHPYRLVIQSYEQVFPKHSIALLPFERDQLIDADIVADFCTRHLAACCIDSARLVRADDSNTSLSAEAMALVMLYRRHFLAEMDDVYIPGSKKLIGVMRAADAAVGAAKPVLRPAVRPMVEAIAADDLLWLRDHHGFVFSDIDYASLTRPRWRLFARRPEPVQPQRLSDVVEIDLSRLHALLDALAAASWFTSSPDRTAWIASVARLSLREI